MIKLKSLIPIACTLMMLSCVKTKDNKKQGTFIIKGQIIQDCAGTKVAGEELIGEYWDDGDWVEAYQHETEIGKAITDSQGRFEIVMDSYGSGEYRITGSSKRTFLRRNLTAQNASVVDLKTIYYAVNFYIVVKLLLTGSFSPTDTLYVGSRKIYPISAGTYYQDFLTITSTGEETDASLTMKLDWSIGKNGTKTKFNSKFAPCVADTTIVNVSK